MINTNIEKYINQALRFSERSDCLRRKYGAVIVDSIGNICSFGYNSIPTGCKLCKNCGGCFRDKAGLEKGHGYLVCPSIHAEQNCIIQSDYFGLNHSTIYIGGFEIDNEGKESGYADPEPCLLCHRMLIRAGIEHCFGITEDGIVEIDISPERFVYRMELERLRINIQSNE